jgi:uncharacterized protein (TIGR01244 family)
MKVQGKRFQLDPTLAGGSQPDRKGLERLARQGFRSVLNLSAEGEEGPQLSPNVEASWAHTFGMQHGRLSVYPDNLRPELVERFQRTLAALPRPVYVESRTGRRAAAFLTLHLGLERGLSSEQAFEAARALDMDCELEELRAFVRAALERRDSLRARQTDLTPVSLPV